MIGNGIDNDQSHLWVRIFSWRYVGVRREEKRKAIQQLKKQINGGYFPHKYVI